MRFSPPDIELVIYIIYIYIKMLLFSSFFLLTLARQRGGVGFSIGGDRIRGLIDESEEVREVTRIPGIYYT